MPSSLSCNLIAFTKYTRHLTSHFHDHHSVFTSWTTFFSGVLSCLTHSACALLHREAFSMATIGNESLDSFGTSGPTASYCTFHLWTSAALVAAPDACFVILSGCHSGEVQECRCISHYAPNSLFLWARWALPTTPYCGRLGAVAEKHHEILINIGNWNSVYPAQVFNTVDWLYTMRGSASCNEMPFIPAQVLDILVC